MDTPLVDKNINPIFCLKFSFLKETKKLFTDGLSLFLIMCQLLSLLFRANDARKFPSSYIGRALQCTTVTLDTVEEFPAFRNMSSIEALCSVIHAYVLGGGFICMIPSHKVAVVLHTPTFVTRSTG